MKITIYFLIAILSALIVLNYENSKNIKEIKDNLQSINQNLEIIKNKNLPVILETQKINIEA